MTLCILFLQVVLLDLKAAVHTNRSAFFDMTNASLKLNVSTPDEVTLSQVPMFHVSGLGQIKQTLSVGGKLVMVDSFDPDEILRLIDAEKITWLTLLPPTTYIRLMDVPSLKDYDTSSVTKIVSAVAAFPKSIMLRLFETFPNASLVYGYGSTETGNGGALDWITREMIEKDLERIKSVGRQFPFGEIRLVDDDGQEVPLGEVGEALVRNPSNMVGYYNNPELTAQTMQDGWLHTGDLLKKDAQGFFYFVDRKKDMIKSGEENVFAPEVEKVMLSHPAVENCAVIGVPDLKWGELEGMPISARNFWSSNG